MTEIPNDPHGFAGREPARLDEMDPSDARFEGLGDEFWDAFPLDDESEPLPDELDFWIESD